MRSVGDLSRLVAIEVDFRPLRLRASLASYWVQRRYRWLAVALYFEGTNATLTAVITQMIAPLEAPLVDDVLFDQWSQRERKGPP